MDEVVFLHRRAKEATTCIGTKAECIYMMSDADYQIKKSNQIIYFRQHGPYKE